LVNKYQDQGLSLFFINSLGKHDKEAVEKIVNLSAPIIEDDANLSGLFNAYPEDTIIVDRDFTIKFKYHLASKALIFNEAMKWTFTQQLSPVSTFPYELEKILQNLTFYDVLSEKRKRMDQIRKKILLTLFTSTCTGCEENTRIQVMKEIAKRLDSDKVKTLFLFGKGNNSNAIRQYAILNDWNEFPFTIGVIEDSKNLSEKDYYKIFQLDTDPRTFIIDSTGELLFVETQRTTKLVNFEHLKKLLK